MGFAPPLFVALIGRLADAHNARAERRMSVQVLGLADTVRKAKAAIDAASTAATRLKSSAEAVVATIGTVNDMTAQLDAANRDLTDAVGVMTNGGPPLESTTSSAGPSTPAVSIPASLAAIEQAHAASDKFPAPPITPVVAPPVVTASTIAQANAANAATLANGTAVAGTPGSV
jgi:hypothetical protein